MEHQGEVDEPLQAAPEHFRPRWAIAFAAHVAAELGQPAHRLPEGGGLRGRLGRLVDGAVERLPLDGLEHHGAGQVRRGAGEQRRVEEAPGDHAEDGEPAPQVLGAGQLALLDGAARLEDFMPDFSPPSIMPS